MRKEFERTTPESAGISSEGILKFLDALEYGGFTQMHGLMIMRHDKIVAEGWWDPFAPGLHHMCNSLTKTYMGTAIGVAYTEGLLDLDDKLYDIFPEYKPENPTEFQENLTIRNTLRFATGMDHFPSMEGNWVKNFINLDLTCMPGTRFFYNSVASTFLGKVIEKLTGMTVYAYLEEKVFPYIGIDAENLDHGIAPEGYDMWAWRTVSTTEDNLRLMKLYKDGGVASGKRILSEEYVKLATSFQTDNSTEANPAADNHVGYGFQMWMCRYPGAYRADGAGGQFSIVIPDKDMIVSINENAFGGAQKTLDAVWDVLMPAVKDDALPENEEGLKKLQGRLKHLSIEHPVFAPYDEKKACFEGSFRASEGTFDFYLRGMGAQENVPGLTPKFAEKLAISFAPMELSVTWQATDRTREKLVFSMDGTRRLNHLETPWEFASKCYANAYFEEAGVLVLELLWPENNSSRTLKVSLTEEGILVSERIMRFREGAAELTAKFVRE
ncbi:MAG: serine hydrolase [Lachnospiraceae bacterium]|nr:serine hydrolase [Lachnospiraceae bacterium]